MRYGSIMPTFTPIATEPRPYGYHELYRFPNGLGASIIVYDDFAIYPTKFSVLKIQYKSRNHNSFICLEAPIFTIAHATRGEVDLTLTDIQSLPTPENIYA